MEGTQNITVDFEKTTKLKAEKKFYAVGVQNFIVFSFLEPL